MRVFGPPMLAGFLVRTPVFSCGGQVIGVQYPRLTMQPLMEDRPTC